MSKPTIKKGQKEGSSLSNYSTPISKSVKVSEASPVKSGNKTPSSTKSAASPPPVLTGPRRVLNDTIVSVHNTVQTWKSLLLKGLSIMQEVQSHRENEDAVHRDCEKLGSIIRQMTALVTKLGEYSEQLFNLALLNTSGSPPFLTWNYKDFYEVAKGIHVAYQKETGVKMELAYNLHECPHEQLNFCIVAWTHVVYIDECKFEGMLIECGLRK